MHVSPLNRYPNVLTQLTPRCRTRKRPYHQLCHAPRSSCSARLAFTTLSQCFSQILDFLAKWHTRGQIVVRIKVPIGRRQPDKGPVLCMIKVCFFAERDTLRQTASTDAIAMNYQSIEVVLPLQQVYGVLFVISIETGRDPICWVQGISATSIHFSCFLRIPFLACCHWCIVHSLRLIWHLRHSC